ncbi:hypothetical protein K493DRAFT_317888 [Basidiobolus meristosporus CBS 931.73]|uniref:Heat shock factor binding protein 1 n=1 Tax=Basidiobolus meristosporus CBS 931.73 TaxID=1314790 RepID=A0A1Y1XYI6_9FUNG|nr:hypothetical protein K493DRAFT_317888 [Basidiobolus meristosporus CBS 931.73]|eukprot:ORX90546.1 hypothetical protein K493DRAFT_317888 [Basidiobolus meristosporus CBS 931.73]
MSSAELSKNSEMEAFEPQDYSTTILNNVKEMQDRLDALSKNIFSKMDDITTKIDELDKTVSGMEADLQTPIATADDSQEVPTPEE